MKALGISTVLLLACVAIASEKATVTQLLKDKKFAQGEVRFVLCPRLGEAIVSKEVTLDDIREAIEALR